MNDEYLMLRSDVGFKPASDLASIRLTKIEKNAQILRGCFFTVESL